jgi:hypothetical protein
LDWFAIDQLGYLGQFTTEGDAPPPFPARANKEANEQSLRLVESLSAVFEVSTLSPDRLPGVRVVSWDWFFSSSVEMARRGVFGFFRLGQNDHGVDEYICVAAPKGSGNLPTGELPAFSRCLGHFALGVVVKVSPDGTAIWIDQV